MSIVIDDSKVHKIPLTLFTDLPNLQLFSLENDSYVDQMAINDQEFTEMMNELKESKKK